MSGISLSVTAPAMDRQPTGYWEKSSFLAQEPHFPWGQKERWALSYTFTSGSQRNNITFTLGRPHFRMTLQSAG